MNARRVLETIDLWKAFGENEVLRGVNLNVDDGETLVVLGPSGCGKSVLLKHIIGLMKPDRGSILVEGRDITRMRLAELDQVRKRFGMVFQGAALFDSMTVGQNVGLPLKEHRGMRGAELDRLVDEKLELVGLSGIAHLWPSQISGGMKKRVALARAIALDPDVILYDEPTTGLDPVRADVINELILKLKRELRVTGIVVTHDMASARKVGDRIIMLHEGKFVFDSPPDALDGYRDERVRRFVEGRASEADLQTLRN
jgi:phospholipid/cholesterol/gamma-HCH transport system ATP-binding protein